MYTISSDFCDLNILGEVLIVEVKETKWKIIKCQEFSYLIDKDIPIMYINSDKEHKWVLPELDVNYGLIITEPEDKILKKEVQNQIRIMNNFLVNEAMLIDFEGEKIELVKTTS